MTSELHVHDWTPWTPSPLSETAGVERRQRTCRGCQLYQDEPTPAAPFGPVPDSAIEAVAVRLYTEHCLEMGFEPCWAKEASGYREKWLGQAADLVVVAVPHIERAIRDRIADELEQIPWGGEDGFTWRDAMSEAARVARGGEAMR
jgi:hypothetical protein